MNSGAADPKYVVERVQTGVRMEKRLLKVLRALADYHDLSLGDLLEGIVLHAFDGKCPFNQDNLQRIKDLKKFYGLQLDSAASHRLVEKAGFDSQAKSAERGHSRAFGADIDGGRSGRNRVHE
jgi:hypothetical protein